MKDPTDTRDIYPRVGSLLWIYITAVTACGTAVFAAALTDLSGLSVLLRTPLFWVLAVMIVVCEIWPVSVPGRASTEAPIVSISLAFAALIVWGLPVAVLLWFSSTVIAGLAQRRALHRAAFNAAASALGMATAGLVLYAVGGRMSPTRPWDLEGDDLLRVVPAAVACFLVSYVLICVAIALHSREPVLKTLEKTLPYEAIVAMILYATAPLVAVIIRTGSAVLLLLFALPIGATTWHATRAVK